MKADIGHNSLGRHDRTSGALEDIENERRPDVDAEYIAEKMADVVTNPAYDRGWRKAQIQDWLERLFDADDDALMREFDFIMTEKEEPEWQAA